MTVRVGRSALGGDGADWRRGLPLARFAGAAGWPRGLHLVPQLPELVGELTQSRVDLFFHGAVVHGFAPYRYGISVYRPASQQKARLVP